MEEEKKEKPFGGGGGSGGSCSSGGDGEARVVGVGGGGGGSGSGASGGGESKSFVYVRELGLETRHPLLEHGDDTDAAIDWIFHSHVRLVRQSVDAILAEADGELVEHLAHVGDAEDLVNVGEALGLVGREVWREQALGRAAPPEVSASCAGGGGGRDFGGGRRDFGGDFGDFGGGGRAAAAAAAPTSFFTLSFHPTPGILRDQLPQLQLKCQLIGH
ncbi:serine, glycine, tyrosine and glutamine-rich protein-like [Selaginella moellendorffii]|uniref:serine, glycine, tyrosine and glutamine-rich protein-like n=1 Tax=Selaginella moellendorffii TaxID=88036 RepID=UPI000D1CB320|nr:serine, glycine, tyrosine and glutamine-rich protein-like [Selaginella moellendorffii]|eukprot:XP_024516853.1 serine, glycine, tyrosine and glutamine-rich protein-like [Selaginella moellendorffii]